MSDSKDFLANVEMISAGAGSGKTYTITERLFAEIHQGHVKPEGVFATTFTRKAAQELVQRVRQKFVEKIGEADPQTSADELETMRLNALGVNTARIDTLHSLCAAYLKRFAFEMGLDPEVRVIDEVASEALFDQAMDSLAPNDLKLLSQLGAKLSIMNTRNADHEKDAVSYLEDIVSQARSNGIDASALPDMAIKSWQTYEAMLNTAHPVSPSVTPVAYERLLGLALDAIEQSGQKMSVGWCRELITIKRSKSYQKQWSKWEFSKFPKKISELPDVERLIDLQSKLAACEAFRNDVKAFIEILYRLAAEVMETYQALKQERGVLDFSDLEAQFLQMLNIDSVQDVLRSELQLLLVDEFQDTNPMQLSIYLKLVPLVDKAVFVGDLKQAIYGFRGADPELMEALWNQLDNAGQRSILDTSYRSTRGVLEHCNLVFGNMFGAEAQLKNAKGLEGAASGDIPAVFGLDVARDKNKANKYTTLAEKLELLKVSNAPVLDKSSKKERLLKWADIAILVTANADVDAMVKALGESGIPAKADRCGLGGTPETVLTLALLKLVDNPVNNLAAAEVDTLLHNRSVDDWLPERLTWLNEHADERRFQLPEPVEFELKLLREQKLALSPAEMLQRIIHQFDIPSMVSRWDSDSFASEQRLGNLDAVCELARLYENQALQNGMPVTIFGFLSFFTGLVQRDKDKQQSSDGDAVSVMTVHKSKGLEWPMVVIDFLGKEVKNDLFSVTVESGGKSFDAAEPLKGRWIRFLPPYAAANSKGINRQAMLASGQGQAAVTRAYTQAQRLLYVAYTRARNYLALVHPKKLDDGCFAALLQDQDWNIEMPIELDRAPVATDSKNSLHWPVAPQVEAIPATLTPSQDLQPVQVKIQQAIKYGSDVKLPVVKSSAILGDAMHLMTGWMLLNPSANSKQVYQKGSAILAEAVDAAHFNQAEVDALVEQAIAFTQAIYSQFKVQRVLVEWPVTARNEANQVIHGSVDLLIQTDSGYVVVDHKLRGGKTAGAQHEAAEAFSGQLAMYKQALQANGIKVTAMALNLFASGHLLTLSTSVAGSEAVTI